LIAWADAESWKKLKDCKPDTTPFDSQKHTIFASRMGSGWTPSDLQIFLKCKKQDGVAPSLQIFFKCKLDRVTSDLQIVN